MLLCDCGSTIVTATCIYVTTRSKWNTLELHHRNRWTISVPLEQPLQRPGVRADSATISGGHHVTHASPFIARAAIIQGRKGAPSPGAQYGFKSRVSTRGGNREERARGKNANLVFS